MIPPALAAGLKLPVIAAPMLLVSSPDLVIACRRAGVIGSLPAANARDREQLDAWLDNIAAAAGPHDAALALNIIVRDPGSERFASDLATAEVHKVPIVITSVGSPEAVVQRVHDYGGIVLHDVARIRHARRAIAAGVDGLILLTAGAGGHTGTANPIAFVREVRRFWGGLIALAGGIADGAGIRAAEIAGADVAYIGSRFAATRESLADDRYKALLVSEGIDDIVTTDRISGLSASFLRGSICAAGLDPDALPLPIGRFRPDLPEGIKAWRDVWSGGHGVGAIDDLPTVADLVARLAREYAAAVALPGWAARS